MDFKMVFGLIVVAFSLVSISHGVEAGRNVKPALKSIRTENGEIFDCVDINKQPALDHPMLRNHTVQMRPSSFPEGLIREDSLTDECTEVELKDGGCPQGTVPIRRIKKGDLIRTKSFFKRNAANMDPQTPSIYGYHYAGTRTTGDAAFYGAQANIGVYNPHVLRDQSSEALMSLSNGPPNEWNSIDVGWAVDPELYGDNQTRFFTYWTVDNYKSTGCFDTRCPGFVQVHSGLQMGFLIRPVSIYRGKQYSYKTSVFQDKATGNWWLLVGQKNRLMGYWPKSIFPSLSGFASTIEWGGAVNSPINEAIKPEMGSGHLPAEGFRSASYFKQIQVQRSDRYEDPIETFLQGVADKPSCYTVGGKTYELGDSGYSFLFGGPGGICGY